MTYLSLIICVVVLLINLPQVEGAPTNFSQKLEYRGETPEGKKGGDEKIHCPDPLWHLLDLGRQLAAAIAIPAKPNQYHDS